MSDEGIQTPPLDLSSDAYHADEIGATPTLSSSIAKILLSQSPAHAWTAHPRLNPNFVGEERSNLDFGTAVHALFLENDETKIQVILANDWRKKEVQAERDAARAYGKVPLLDKDMVKVEALVAALRERVGGLATVPPMFSEGKVEQTLVWEDRGVMCRARLDWLRDDLRAIDDLKTTNRSANPQTWARQLFSMGYDVQAAFYIRAVTAALGPQNFDAVYRLAIIETEPPFGLAAMTLSPAGLALANAKVDRALDLWKRCLDSDSWPGYPQRLATVDPPAWVEEQFWASVDAGEEA